MTPNFTAVTFHDGKPMGWITSDQLEDCTTFLLAWAGLPWCLVDAKGIVKSGSGYEPRKEGKK